MSSRPVKVTSLSDKIQGLKFMQRAAAAGVSTSEKAAASTEIPSRGRGSESHSSSVASNQSQAADAGAQGQPDKTDDGNEEHWSMPSAPNGASTSATSDRITVQPGWNQWLGDRLRAGQGQTGAADAGSASASSARRSFGSWARSDGGNSTSKARRGGGEGASQSDEDSRSSQSDDEDEDDGRKAKSKGFIKPGTLSSKKEQKRLPQSISNRGSKESLRKTEKRPSSPYGTKRKQKDGVSSHSSKKSKS